MSCSRLNKVTYPLLGIVLGLLAADAGGAPVAAAPAPAVAADPLFERDVLPILTSNCLGCHGGLRQKGGLDLRSIPHMLKGGEAGPAVKAGDPAASHLWEAIAGDDMPKGEKKLSAAEKATVRAWIAAGLPTVAQRRTPADADPLLGGDRQHPAAAVAAAIDRHVDRGLADVGLAPAPPADDAEFLRRAYLDLTGRVPTAEQAAAFLDDAAADKRAKLIDALLASPQFGEQFGRTWRDWIAPPELPSDANGGKQPHAETQALGKWIGDRVTAGDGWDRIVRQMVGAEAEIKNNPQVIFLGLLGEGGTTSPAGSARGVASLFMGVQLQCAQCHDDPYRTWAQDEYWALAAFFSKANGGFGRVFEVPPPPKPNPDPKKAAEEAKRREEAAKRAKPVDPATFGTIVIPKSAFLNAGRRVPAKFLDGTAFKPNGDEPLRPRLLDWLTDKGNPYFAKSFVNRTWGYFFNRGIVHPVDDMRELNPPSHPGLLALLEREFVSSNYDVKHVARSICNSRAYQRTSRPSPASGNGPDDVAVVARFGQMPPRVMSADALYDSLRQAYGDPKLDLRPIDPKDGNTNGESAPVGDAYLEFRRSFCTNEEDATDFTHGIPQLLTMMNHPRLTAGSKALDAHLKANPTASAERVVAWLYLSTLSRRPTDAEATEAAAFVAGSPDRARAYAGLLWVLVNRSEYLMVR